jgi:hypothetical protein
VKIFQVDDFTWPALPTERNSSARSQHRRSYSSAFWHEKSRILNERMINRIARFPAPNLRRKGISRPCMHGRDRGRCGGRVNKFGGSIKIGSYLFCWFFENFKKIRRNVIETHEEQKNFKNPKFGWIGRIIGRFREIRWPISSMRPIFIYLIQFEF